MRQQDRKILIMWLAALVLAMFPIMLYFHNAHKAYHDQALQVLTELEKIQAATESGINYMRYTEKIADTNYLFKKFSEAYGEGSAYSSRKDIADAMSHYLRAGVFWRAQMNNDANMEKTWDELRVQCWQSATQEIQQANQDLKAGN